MTSRAEAAQKRSEGVRQPSHRPSERRSGQDTQTGRSTPPLTARLQVQREAGSGGPAQLRGYASVSEQPYDMWDMFGPYTEVVSQGAFGTTLASEPDVVLNYQHGKIGTPIARSTIRDGEGSLTLAEDASGLAVDAQPASGLWTTNEMLRLIEVGILTEMSFAFTITRGKWSPDYTEYRIDEVDINRGDVSIVNYGANPGTSIGLRSSNPAQARMVSITRALQQNRALTAEDAAFVATILGMASSIDLIVDEMQEDLAEALGVPNPDDESDDVTVTEAQRARSRIVRAAAALDLRRS